MYFLIMQISPDLCLCPWGAWHFRGQATLLHYGRNHNKTVHYFGTFRVNSNLVLQKCQNEILGHFLFYNIAQELCPFSKISV